MRSEAPSNETKNSSTTVSAKSSWREVFALDYRSLALYRILMGLMLLADLVFRLPTLAEMYTDSGTIPRKTLFEYYDRWIGANWDYGVWSFHWIRGEAWWQYLLFAIAALAALALTFGWKTRIATIVSWALLASLHARNPLILTSGDTILKLALFWSIFLPLGRIWSLDARGLAAKPLSRKCFFSLATVGFILQIILMYFFTGVAKCNEDWFSGDAMYYVLRLDIYVLPLGSWLLDFPVLMTVLTYGTLLLEVILIWFLLSPKRNEIWRLVVLLAFWGFHIGIGCTMAIGLFPWICLVIWIPILPSMFWNWLSKATIESSEASDENSWGLWEIATQVVLALALAFTFLINVSNVENSICKKFMPRTIAPIGYWLNLDQRFQMFGRPPKSNPWFVYEARLRDKTQIDLMRDSIVDHERPKIVRLSLPGHHWRKLHRNLMNPALEDVRQSLADFAVRDWNANHPEEQQVVRMQLLCYSEETGPQYDGTSVKQVVWGSYVDPENSAGSNFDSAIEDILDGMPF
jgi:hypothetical protein